MIYSINSIYDRVKQNYLKSMRILSGIILVVLGCVCVVGYIKEYMWLLATASLFILATGFGVIWKNKVALRSAMVIYCLLSISIITMLVLPHPKGDTANNDTIVNIIKVLIIILGIMSYPALRDNKRG